MAGTGSIAALQASDTVKEATAAPGVRVVARTMARDSIYLAQTPQAFSREILEQAIQLGREAFVTATRATCDALLHVVDITAGLETVGWLPHGLEAQHITTLAAARGLEVRPLSAYVLHRPQPPGLVLGFATVPAPTMPQAVQRLAEVIRTARGHRRREAPCC